MTEGASSMNREVFLSLLSMDAFHRGPEPLVNNLPLSGRIGTATILTDGLAELDPNTVLTAGFYDIAYDWNNSGINETVISYRGTNFPDLTNVTEEAFNVLDTDVWRGNAFVAC